MQDPKPEKDAPPLSRKPSRSVSRHHEGKLKMKVDIDSQKIDWALKVIRNDLLPSEKDYGPESMQGGHGEALTIAIAVLEAVRKHTP
jgi:hypothetical protein